MPGIETKRLRMIPLTVECMRAALYNRKALARMCNARIPEEWPLEDLKEILPLLINDFERDPWHRPWDGIIIHKADSVVIGDMGLKSGPNKDGVADVGYSILPAYRNQGYATEMLKGLLSWSFEHGIKAITASCINTNTSSIRVLEKAGMRQKTSIMNLLSWELQAKEWPQ